MKRNHVTMLIGFILIFTLSAANPCLAVLPDNLTINVGDVDGDSQDEILVLEKRSTRSSSSYEFFTYDQTNGLVEQTPLEVRTYRGYIQDEPDMRINGSFENVDGVEKFYGFATDGRQVDISMGGLVGVDVTIVPDEATAYTADMPSGNVVISRTVDRTSPTPSGYIIPKYTCRRMGICLYLPFDYYEELNSDLARTVARAEQRVNDTDAFYARDLGMAIEIVKIIVNTTDNEPTKWENRFALDGVLDEGDVYNSKVQFKKPGGGGSSGRVFDASNAKASNHYYNGHSCTNGTMVAYSKSFGHELGHGFGAGHYMSFKDIMSGSNSFINNTTLQTMIGVSNYAVEPAAPAIIYGAPLSPAATEDSVNCLQDGYVDFDPLENDYDSNGDTISLDWFTEITAKGATVEVVSGSTIRYTPLGGFSGEDMIYYHAKDSTGISNRDGRCKIIVRNTGLASHLLLDETSGEELYDIGPYQAHGKTYQDLSTANNVPGMIGTAIEKIPSESDSQMAKYFGVGDPLDGDLSVSLWVNYDEVPTVSNAIICKGGAVIPGKLPFPKSGWTIGHITGEGFFFGGNLQSNAATFSRLAPMGITADVWYHLVMTIDRTNKLVKAWVNGIEVTGTRHTTTVEDGIIEHISSLRLYDAVAQTSQGNWAGPIAIDDVRIFNNVLTDAEVADLYNNSPTYDIPAGAPSPKNYEQMPTFDTTLSWVAGKPATYEFDLYLGTDPVGVANATTASAEYIGRYTEPTASVLRGTSPVYYWRVDEVRISDSGIVPGPMWTFKSGVLDMHASCDMGTTADTAVDIADLDAVTTSATWDWYNASMASKFVADASATDYGLLFDRSDSATGRYLEFNLDLTSPNANDFANGLASYGFDMAISRAGTAKAITIYGYGPEDTVVFRAKVNADSSKVSVWHSPSDEVDTGVTINYLSSAGAYDPNAMLPFAITLNPNNTGSELTYRVGNYSGSAGFMSDERQLAKIKFEFIGTSNNGQGFWLDNITEGFGEVPPNSAPTFILSPISTPHAIEDVSYSDTIENLATDADGDPITFTKVSGPAWLTVDADGLIHGTPDASDVGSNLFIVKAADASSFDQETLEIDVHPSNFPPSFTSDPINEVNAYINDVYSSTIADNASDPEENTMTFTKVSGPDWLSISSYGDLSGTPDGSDIGSNVFTIQVEAEGGSDSATLNITVLDEDTTKPTPDPMTFASPPTATSQTSITMTASTASDTAPVEYYFTCTAGGGNDSGWQASATYEDTGLTAEMQYTYTVKVRDMSPNQNSTAASTEASATTELHGASCDMGDAEEPFVQLVDLDAVSTHATWDWDNTNMSTLIVADSSNSDHGLLFDSSGSVKGNYLEFNLDMDADFSDRAHAISFDMAKSRAGTGKAVTIYGYGPQDSVIFKIYVDCYTGNKVSVWRSSSNGTNTGWDIGSLSSAAAYDPNTMTPFTITLDPDNTGSELTYDVGTYSGSAGFLTTERQISRIKFEITGTTDVGQGFWLDNVILANLDETDPPTPNPATFALAPRADSGKVISMTATIGTDVSDPVEYLFTETSGNPGATSSQWQTSPSYIDSGLNPSTQYSYTVIMRDSKGNTTAALSPVNATTDGMSLAASCDMGTTADTAVDIADLDAVTTGAAWDWYNADMASKFVADATATDYGLLFDRASNATGRYLEFNLNGIIDFSSEAVTCSFDMAKSRGGSSKAVTVYGYGPQDSVIFQIEVDCATGNNVSVWLDSINDTDTGWEVISISSSAAYDPNTMTPFTITLDPDNTGSELTYEVGTYSGSAGFLTTERQISRIKFEITGSSNKGQGYWLDNVIVENSIPATLTNLAGFAKLSSYWMKTDICASTTWCDGYDYDRSGTVDFIDLSKFAENWLK